MCDLKAVGTWDHVAHGKIRNGVYVEAGFRWHGESGTARGCRAPVRLAVGRKRNWGLRFFDLTVACRPFHLAPPRAEARGGALPRPPAPTVSLLVVIRLLLCPSPFIETVTATQPALSDVIPLHPASLLRAPVAVGGSLCSAAMLSFYLSLGCTLSKRDSLSFVASLVTDFLTSGL